MPFAPPSTNHHGTPSGPRLATQPLSPNPSTRSPRVTAPRILRNDSFASAPSDLNGFAPISRTSTFDSLPSRRPPPSTTIGATVRTDNVSRAKSLTPSGGGGGPASPMFFHASEVKGLRPAKPFAKPPVSNAKFFYASESPRNGSTSRSHSPVGAREASQNSNNVITPSTQFVQASAPKIHGPTSTVGSAFSKTPHVKYSKPDENNYNRRRDLSPDNRPISPPYDSSSGSASSNRLMASPILSTSPPKPSFLSHPPPQALPTPQKLSYVQPQSRRQSVDLTPRRHGRSNSVIVYGEPVIKVHGNGDSPNGYDHPHDNRTSPKSPTVPFHALSNAAAIIEQQKELAAAARRERKILDLEISNASLLAINKTFERRMRKQTAEIRRFKRLSRAGLLAPKFEKTKRRKLDDTSASEEGDLDASEEDEEDEEDEDLDEEDEDDEDEDEESPGEGSADGDTPSKEPSEKSLARAATDKKHLESDIAKHRALLEASAKMNASLKRCQMVTETLIEEGRRALTYVVRPSEVKIKPRVINHHDDDAVTESEVETEFDEHFQDDTTDGYSTPTYQESEFDSQSASGDAYSRSDSRSYSRSDSRSDSNSLSGVSDDYYSDDSRFESSVYSVDPPDLLTPRDEHKRVLG